MSDLINIVKEHWEYRQQLIKLAKADLVKTYRGAALGWSWAIIKPAVTIFVYWFTFEIGLRSGRKCKWLSILLMAYSRSYSMVLYK